MATGITEACLARREQISLGDGHLGNNLAAGGLLQPLGPSARRAEREPDYCAREGCVNSDEGTALAHVNDSARTQVENSVDRPDLEQHNLIANPPVLALVLVAKVDVPDCTII